MADPTTLDLGVDPFAIAESARRTWRQLERQTAGCTACGLHTSRTHAVLGAGDPDADLMIVGDAPSRHDDLLGKPFVGGAGNLLTNVLHDVGVRREDVYVTSFVKCHPPEGRAPRPAEIGACSGYLLEQLAWVRPRVVVTLGELAMRQFVRRGYPLDRVAGVRFDLHGATLIPTFHPADALQGDHRALEGLRRDLATAAAVLAGTLAGGTDRAGAPS